MTDQLSLITALPFILTLLSIAIIPLAAPHFWEHNRNKAVIAGLLATPILVYFLGHDAHLILKTVEEYFSFIVLLGSLYVIAGGINISGDLKATPKVNACFLGIGAILANLIGTTGASMILIRSYLNTNKERKKTKHLPVFFIFIVANCAGMLTPLGDPPLFLGYLRGVPFFWTLKLFPIWFLATSLLLGIFYSWDTYCYRHETKRSLQKDRTHVYPLHITGLINLLYLGGVVGAVFLATPWRELAMLCLAGLSLWTGPKLARQKNHFAWGPILEVAILFAGIFITMIPALELLRAQGPEFGINKPYQFFWLTGILSSFLDNAPTYLTFVSLAQGLNLAPEVIGIPAKILMAISAGAVLMGANSYIGNGPNFMVKAISDHAGIKAPSFFGYMGYALVILFPVYGLIHWVFF
ncbi:MAG: hypothetical protein ACD_62C00483G0002 [uncultured bacterium]|nr:MAG: hypothetical protein ACD_62C00483G0002 [uncultured bacterium]